MYHKIERELTPSIATLNTKHSTPYTEREQTPNYSSSSSSYLAYGVVSPFVLYGVVCVVMVYSHEAAILSNPLFPHSPISVT